MNVTIETIDGKEELVIRMPLGDRRLSSTGKSVLIATTGGNLQTSLEIDGKPLTVAVNAYIKK